VRSTIWARAVTKPFICVNCGARPTTWWKMSSSDTSEVPTRTLATRRADWFADAHGGTLSLTRLRECRSALK